MHAHMHMHLHMPTHTQTGVHTTIHTSVYTNRYTHISRVLMYTHEYMRVYEQTTVVNSSELITCCLLVFETVR